MWIRYGAVTTIFSVIAFPSTSVLFSHTFNVVILHNSFYSEARIQKPCLDGATGFFGGANRPNRPWVLLLFYICQGWTFEFLGLGGLFVLWTSVSSPEHKPPLSEQSVVRIQAACFARQLRPSNAFLPARIPGFIAVFFYIRSCFSFADPSFSKFYAWVYVPLWSRLHPEVQIFRQILGYASLIGLKVGFVPPIRHRQIFRCVGVSSFLILLYVFG